MDQHEKKRLDRIQQSVDETHTEVQRTNTELQVVKERVESIDSRIDNNQEILQSHDEDIDDLQDSVRRNTTIIGGVTTAISAALIWGADKIRVLI
jgi:chromosome segregation ATPase